MFPAPSLQSARTAHRLNKPSGWITITHPFHPWLGQRFQIRTCRDTGGVRMLGLINSCGTMVFVPIEWTDRDPPPPQPTFEGSQPILDARCLLSVARSIKQIRQRTKEKKD